LKENKLAGIPTNGYIHMIGIGGISMSALAHMLKFFGYRVSGSDRTETRITESLKAAGVEVCIGHSADAVCDPDLVCYTAAIPKDNPELVKARSLGIPVMERAELLGELMKLYKYPVAVAGTHGKTTTTSMLSLVLLEANLDPTILVGGELSQIGGNYKIGAKDYLVFEACEYVESFLHFNPYISIITNVEEDHLDYFSGISHIITAFERFARLNSPDGCIIVCSDDKNAMTVVQNIKKNVVKYGLISRNNDFFAENAHFNASGKTEVDIFEHGEFAIKLELSVHGDHNVRNALGAYAAARTLGIDAETVKRGLEAFGGTKRRFETLGEANGFTVYDDYAHHPTEIKTTVSAVAAMDHKKLWCIFQPHTFTRTAELFDEFSGAFAGADHVICAEIYAARETENPTGVSAEKLAAAIPGAVCPGDFDAICAYVSEKAEAGDIVLVMGAGDITAVSHRLVSGQ